MTQIQWWCAAQGGAWTGAWQAYPGVWLVIAAVAAIGWRGLPRPRSTPSAAAGALTRSPEGFGSPLRRPGTAWALGTIVLWAALDWPLGPLGASYLASVHMLQYLMIGMIAPALFLLGVPDGAWEALARRPRLVSLLQDLANPVAAFVIFNVGMTVTHWPGVVDALRVSQAGSFALDAVWLACGLVFWWPLVAPVPAQRWFTPPMRLAYLFLNGVLPAPPALMLLFSELPIYAVYELAPPISAGFSVVLDQQLAGAIMKAGSMAIAAVAMLAIAGQWIRQEKRAEAALALRAE